MITLDKITKFVEQYLAVASQHPESADYFEKIAYGAIQFAIQVVGREQPEIVAMLIYKWNNEWHDKFTQLYK